MSKKSIILIVIISVIVFIAICTILFFILKNKFFKNDGWQYNPNKQEIMDKIFSNTVNKGMQIANTSIATDEAMMGLSVGGAKDTNNFRENIKNGYFPLLTDITYNGLFYNYSFDITSKNDIKDDKYLFNPTYSFAVSKDPVSNQDEYYMTVGLKSNIKESDFSRKKLNLVVLLDISGSMGSSLDRYYYDDPSLDMKERSNKSKMQLANESVTKILDNLNENDYFGMVLFDSEAYLGKEISLIKDTDVDSIKRHILEIKAKGGTNFESGYEMATKLFENYKNIDKTEYENRIIVLTDAMPNMGKIDDSELMQDIRKNSLNGINTTFVGVGVDFNTEVIEKLSDARGANYYSVHNSKEFDALMTDQFDYMVTPLVYDLKLDVESDSFEVEKVFGSDTADVKTGNILNVNTLFPSKTNDAGEVKGGVILLKLKKKSESNNQNIKLKISYKDRTEKQINSVNTVAFDTKNVTYDNTGIRKAIMLTRYANTIRDYIMYERTKDDRYVITIPKGIFNIDDEEIKLVSQNERVSVNLTVSDNYKEIFKTLKNYMEKEILELKDNSLNEELKILDLLINNNN